MAFTELMYFKMQRCKEAACTCIKKQAIAFVYFLAIRSQQACKFHALDHRHLRAAR
jgi:hypothetical protein